MRSIFISFLLVLFITGVAANNYGRMMGEDFNKFSLVEEEEEHKEKLYELHEIIVNESFFEDYIITSLNVIDDVFHNKCVDYEDVYLSCIETPPDFNR